MMINNIDKMGCFSLQELNGVQLPLSPFPIFSKKQRYGILLGIYYIFFVLLEFKVFSNALCKSKLANSYFFCSDSVLYSLWGLVNPESEIDKYKIDVTNMFGYNMNLKTTTVANICQTIGFQLGVYFKVVSVTRYKKTQRNNHHFDNCKCLASKYNTNLIFSNKCNSNQNAYTYIYVNKECVYFSETEIFGRTLSKAITESSVSTILPSNRNLVFLYSFTENLFCILNRVDGHEYFGVEILSDGYLITPISKPKSLQSIHLAYETIQPLLRKSDDKQIHLPSKSCMCNMIEDEIKIKPLGKQELMNNIQIHLHSLGIYHLYEHIFTFISRIKMISYDIETQASDVDELHSKLQKKNGDVYSSQNMLEYGTILNKLDILLIGCSTYISVSCMKSIIRTLSGCYINEDIIQPHLKKRFDKSYCRPSFNANILNITTKHFDPEILVFEDVKLFFAHLVRFTRLSEYLTHILLSGLIHHLKIVKAKGLISLLMNNLKKWIPLHYVFAFNGANFDNILIENSLSPYLLHTYKSKIKISKLCNGLSCVSLTYTINKKVFTNSQNIINICNKKYKDRGTCIIFRDTRKIVSRGTLNDLANVYDLPVNKLTFPYSFLKNKEFLVTVTVDNLNTHNDLFYDSLKFCTMSEKDQQSFKQDFKNSKCENLFQYLKLYLNRDVLILHKLMNKLLDAFNQLGCNIILQKKLTISNIAFSNIYIFENIDKLDFHTLKLSTSKFINHVIKQSVIGGYCCTNITDVNVDSDFIINNNLSYSDKLSNQTWHEIPGMYVNSSFSNVFNKTCKKILSYDIR